MTDLGDVKVFYLDPTGSGKQKKSASGKGTDRGSYVEVNLNPSLKRTKFNTILIPWIHVQKVIVFE
mgnify:CR=1 FL=1